MTAKCCQHCGKQLNKATQYKVITHGGSTGKWQEHGPFSSYDAADKFVNEYQAYYEDNMPPDIVEIK